jgi:hypothetical protein
VDATRKAPATPSLTDAEAITMMKTQVAWTGRYTLAEQTAEGIKLTARVEQRPVRRSSPQIAYVSYESMDKLVVNSPGVIVPMTGQTSVVEFELVKAD